MSPALLLALCLAAGIVLRASGRLTDSAPAALNAYVINLALPALVLHHLHRAELTFGLMASAAGAWVMLGTAALFFGYIARRARLDAATTGALILTGGLANTSFVGLPMIEAWIGREGLAHGIVIDQLGSYLALSTLGLLLAARYAGQSTHWRDIGKRVITFPPLIALAAALLLRPVPFPAALDDVFGRLGATVAPIALLSVGCQLRIGELQSRLRALAWGLGYKLLLGPLVIAAICLMLIDGNTPAANLTRAVIIFEAAMGPMIGAAVVANHYKLDSGTTSLMVGLGVPLSLMIAPAWLALAYTMS